MADNINDLTSWLKKLSTWAKILILFVILVWIYNHLVLYRINMENGIATGIVPYDKYNKGNGTSSALIEGFTQTNRFVFKTGPEIYDDFYANIYDFLVFNNQKDDYEIGEIINRTTPTAQSKILDIGSGLGHHVEKLSQLNYDTMGIDISPSMIKVARERYPNYDFRIADAMDNGAVSHGVYTHILCLYFTVYYFQDKLMFFQNAMEWLQPGGYLILHLVNREMFNPILPPGNPLLFVSPQKYAKERITHTKLIFDQFEYTANFELNKGQDQAKFVERFSFNDGKSRKNEHVFHMETQESILRQAQDAGFILDSKIDLMHCAYDFQYLYVLVKPN